MKREIRYTIRLNEEEREFLKKEAKKADMKTSEFIRWRLLQDKWSRENEQSRRSS